VIVPRHFAGPFTYRIPTQLRAVLRVGHLVFVPFGRSLVQGAVIALTSHHPPTVPLERLKAIRTVVTAGRAVDISPPLLKLAKAVAEAYVAPWGQCLRLVLPPRSTMVDSSRIILTKEGQDALVKQEAPSPVALQLLKRLKRRPLGIPLSRLCHGKDRTHEDVVASIVERGWAHQVRSPSIAEIPDWCGSAAAANAQSPAPAAARHAEWEAHLLLALQGRKAARLFMQADHAERLALLRAAATRTVELGRKVLVITGETSRAETLAAALAHVPAVTVVLHSMMSDSKRSAIWEQIRLNHVSIVVGTRGAVFAPLDRIGLIWIDREEDSALKEPMEPRYHARDVAWMRALEEEALLVVGSAHLSLEATGLESPQHLLKAPRRPDTLPQIEVVDLRVEDRRMLLSARLRDAMSDAISRRAGVLLFLNRKAYAGALVCRDCGHVPRCSSCAVAFAFSRQKRVLFCHYCGAADAISDLCAACGSPRLQPVGEGTERLEEEVKRRFPSARVLRVDGESLRRPKEAVAIWACIRRREWDVLVGTQVLLRDDLVPPVPLVAAVLADAGLSVPDFRAAERTFHLLQDAGALADPGPAGGRFIIQTYLPSHHVIEAVARQNDEIFSAEELLHRTSLGFPPAVRLVALHVSGGLESTVEEAAQAWATALSRASKTMPEGEHLTLLGPVRPPVARARGRYRRQILIKSPPNSTAVQVIHSTLADLESLYARRTVKFDVDVDPIEMW
jgi:primosomal protein N' (replication factor Y)